eukprot:TRINITY_DN6677_c0_g2_i2.p1 TRINITY_DN6677_c0_g2~~TRINITY_DN6677_c0_g2_i2.p1  ORF type:complete len:157 (-),score=26.50 TRINITY_DN6677_c0_g2_i2:39-509(-)
MDSWIFMGPGSGGYLATTTAYQLAEKRIKGVINLSGLTELGFYLRNGYDQRKTVVEFLLEGNSSLAEEFSSSQFITKLTPSTLTIHGTGDSIVPMAVNQHLHNVLNRRSISEWLMPLQLYDHMLTGSFYAHANQLCFYAMEHFMARVTHINCSKSL